MLKIHIKGTLKNLQSEEKYVPGMDIVNHLVQPLSTKRVGYQRPIQKYVKLEKGIPIIRLKNEAQNGDFPNSELLRVSLMSQTQNNISWFYYHLPVTKFQQTKLNMVLLCLAKTSINFRKKKTFWNK